MQRTPSNPQRLAPLATLAKLATLAMITLIATLAATPNAIFADTDSKAPAASPAEPKATDAASKTDAKPSDAPGAEKPADGSAEKPTAAAASVKPVKARPSKQDDGHNPFAKAVAIAQKRCVRIHGAGIGREKGYASGIIVSDEGHILTANGIYLAGNAIRVAMHDGRIYMASIVRRSDGLQAALLKIDAKTPDHFVLPEKMPADKGDWIISVSNAFKVADRAEALSVNLGVITLRAPMDARHRTQDVDYDGDVLLYDAITSNPGAAGGAVVNMDGQLVGMIGKLILSTSTNTRLNYAVPADQLKRFFDGDDKPKVADAQPKGDPYLGVRLFTLSGKRAPAYVDRVTPGSPAKEAGLRKDDLILVIADQIVRSVRDYEKLEPELRPGDEIKVVFKRKDQVLTTTLTVGEKK